MQTPISDPQVVEKTGSDVWEILGGSLPALEKHLPCLDVKPHLYQHEMLVKVTSAIVEMENQTKPKEEKVVKHLHSNVWCTEVLTHGYSGPI